MPLHTMSEAFLSFLSIINALLSSRKLIDNGACYETDAIKVSVPSCEKESADVSCLLSRSSYSFTSKKFNCRLL